jgi:hypothetical protein
MTLFNNHVHTVKGLSLLFGPAQHHPNSSGKQKKDSNPFGACNLSFYAPQNWLISGLQGGLD